MYALWTMEAAFACRRLLRFRWGRRMAGNGALADEIRDLFRCQTENGAKNIGCVFAQQGRRLGLAALLRS